MNDLKMIASDMDGTFLSDDKLYDIERFIKQLEFMKEHDIKFVAASGNQVQHLKHIFKPAIERGFKLDYVASNGALVVSGDEIVHASTLTKEQMSKVIQWNADNPASSGNLVVLNGINGSYVSNHATEQHIKLLKIWYHNLRQVEKFAEVEDDILEVTFIWNLNENVSERVEELRQVFGDQLHATGSGFGSVDILAPNANKATGLQYLQDRYGIQNDQIVVFGDNQNDLEMLKKYPQGGYVMPNAEEFMHDQVELKALADNNNDGVLKTIDSLLENLN